MHIYPAPFLADREYALDSSLCFVIMPFMAPWSNRAYEQLKTIVERSGYRCSRGDDFFGRVVLQDVWRGLNEAAFVVAELSAQNPNVYYELGLAHALGKQIIPLLQHGESVPFDQTPFRILFYEDSDDGYQFLHSRLSQWIASLDFSAVPELMIRNGRVREFNAWRQTHVLRSLLREGFSRTSLQGIDLHDANLAEADMSGSDLRDAELSHANLIRANLEGTDLRGAKLVEANLSEARLAGAKLGGADLRRAIFLRSHLSGADLAGAHVGGLTIDRTSYSRFEALFAAAVDHESVIVER